MAVIAKPPCDEAAILTGVADGADARQGRWVLAATILGSSLAFIDSTVVNVAPPALQSAVDATMSGARWVVEAYGERQCSPRPDAGASPGIAHFLLP